MDKREQVLKTYLIILWSIIISYIIRQLYWLFMISKGLDHIIDTDSDCRFMFELGYISILLSLLCIITLFIKKKITIFV